MQRIGGLLDLLVPAVAVGPAVAQSAAVLLGDDPAATRAVQASLLVGVVVVAGLPGAAVRSGRWREADGPESLAGASRHVVALVPVCLLPLLVWALAPVTGAEPLAAAVFVACGAAAAALLLARAVLALLAAEWVIDHDLPTQVLSLTGIARALRARTRRPGEGPLAFCLVSLDDFKGVNDALGGARANTVLAMVARRLTVRLGERATVGRLGGDRFLTVLPDHADAGQEVLQALAEPFRVEDRTVHLTASVGTAPVTPDVDVQELLGMADLAVQAAKVRGKATVVRYRRELHEQVHAARRMERELRALLDGAPPERVGRVGVVFQPIVELASHRIVGCEALARWRDPEGRVILPDTFLPVAEQGGFVAHLDGLVLDRALGAVARWDAEGLGPVTVSVNLGRGSLTDPGLLPRVRACVQEHGLAFDRVRLEITEHDELPDDDVVTRCLRDLTELGARLSLDDFGAGYTSLNYLCRYPVDLVKIDRSIVLAESARDRSPLLEGIVGLASGLHVDVLAEGIESEEQRQRLVRIGVGQGQGYLFARPLEAAAFTEVMRRAAAR